MFEVPLLKDYLPKDHYQMLIVVETLVMVEEPLLKDYLPKHHQKEPSTNSYLCKKKQEKNIINTVGTCIIGGTDFVDCIGGCGVKTGVNSDGDCCKNNS